MAEQDFDINIRTLADLTGIKLTQAQLEALQNAAREGNQKATQALKQLADAQRQAQDKLNLGFTGSAIGIGTITSLVTGAISKWKAFNDEQDRMVEGMIRAEEKARALGESILEIQDKAISLRRIDTEPLEQSFQRLQHEIAVLKVELSLLNLPEQGEEWKKINAEISKNESLLDRVTASLKKQADEAEKAAKAKEKAAAESAVKERAFGERAFESASPQAKAILAQEAAARGASAAGDERAAGLFEKSAEAFRRGATPEQLAEAEQLAKLLQEQNQILGQIRDAWQ